MEDVGEKKEDDGRGRCLDEFIDSSDQNSKNETAPLINKHNDEIIFQLKGGNLTQRQMQADRVLQLQTPALPIT